MTQPTLQTKISNVAESSVPSLFPRQKKKCKQKPVAGQRFLLVNTGMWMQVRQKPLSKTKLN
jgi:hypothetical protein